MIGIRAQMINHLPLVKVPAALRATCQYFVSQQILAGGHGWVIFSSLS